jgi:hypothetical protein
MGRRELLEDLGLDSVLEGDTGRPEVVHDVGQTHTALSELEFDHREVAVVIIIFQIETVGDVGGT